MLACGIFWLLVLFILPVLKITPPEYIRNNWMLLNPSGEFAIVPLLSFVKSPWNALGSQNSASTHALATGILFLALNGIWLISRTVALMKSPISRLSIPEYIALSATHILLVPSLLWIWKSMNSLSCSLTHFGWISIGLSIAMVLIMYPLKRLSKSQMNSSQQESYETNH